MIPPSGTVAFLFTDVEGSTAWWELHPDEMRHALELHDHVLRGAFDRLGDPETREQRGAAGRQTVIERFGLEAYRQRYRRLLIPESSDV